MKPFAITHVVAATDLTETSLPALRYARLFADRFAAPLTITYIDRIVYPGDFAGTGPGLYLNMTPERVESLRKEVAQHAEAAMDGRPYDVDVRVGVPVPSILQAAEECSGDLIVLGTHLRHGWRRALIGSTSDAVLHGSKCPVLTVAGQDRGAASIANPITHILCPVNFTDVARDSLEAARKLAEVFQARLTVVHVLEADEAMDIEADEYRVRRWFGPELHGAGAVRTLVLRGGPAERVLDCAEDAGADLIVTGAQHKLFRDSTVVGTTTERLIRFASAPVLVVPRQAVRRTVEAEERELMVVTGS